MVKYSNSAITAKNGMNFIRSIVEAAGSLFHKIEQENDLGVDGIIEFIDGSEPTGVQSAVQIKSGDSYFNPRSLECEFPVMNHRKYWQRYPLPVIGIVYVPALDAAFWVDVKAALKRDEDLKTIRFRASASNRLDLQAFKDIFQPLRLGEPPLISIDEALVLTKSQFREESALGLRVLIRRFPNETRSWDAMIDMLVGRSSEEIPMILPYYLAHVPGHGDIIGYTPGPGAKVRRYAKARMAKFGRNEVVKLLSMIDPEDGIARGTIGQSVEAVISSLTDVTPILCSILEDPALELHAREMAAEILAIHLGAEAIPLLTPLLSEGSWFAKEIVRTLEEFGGLNPY